MSKWTEKEDGILREHYEAMGPAALSRSEKLPGRSREAIRRRASRLGLQNGTPPRVWTDEEKQLLREHYPRLGAVGMHAQGFLTDRSLSALKGRASLLGVRRLAAPKSKNRILPHADERFAWFLLDDVHGRNRQRTLVDREHVDRLVSCGKWSRLTCSSGHVYAYRNFDGKTTTLQRYIVTEILGNDLCDGDIVLHRNGQELDNRVSNLVVGRHGDRQLYEDGPRDHGFHNLPRGVSLGHPRRDGSRPYIVQLRVRGTSYYLGSFDDPDEAHQHYLRKRRQLRPSLGDPC